MRPRVLTYVVYGQISFWFFTAICVSLHPGFVLKANEGGMSNYGIHVKTALFYTLALGLTALFNLLAARSVDRSSDAKGLEWVVGSYGVMLLVVLLSTYPYTLSSITKDVHYSVGVALAVAELLGSLWLYPRVKTELINSVFLAVQVTGLVMLVLTGSGVAHVLFATQMVIAAGFGALLLSSTRRLTFAQGPAPTATTVALAGDL